MFLIPGLILLAYLVIGLGVAVVAVIIHEWVEDNLTHKSSPVWVGNALFGLNTFFWPYTLAILIGLGSIIGLYVVVSVPIRYVRARLRRRRNAAIRAAM